jgi:NAD(P)-dependent dehydrogenase (short-subunit alcohol dehydrogenase family)
MSFLGLEGYHVFVTGAAGGIGSQAVKEFLGEFSELLRSQVHQLSAHAKFLRKLCLL